MDVKALVSEVVCGDCMEGIKSFEDKFFDLAITDPPYNVGFEYNGYDDERKDYKEWCASWLSELERVTKGVIAISCGIVNLGMWHEIKKPTWVACWHKPATMGRSPLGFNNWEPIVIYGKPVKQSVDVIRAVIIPDSSLDFHPCPKPLAWAKQQIFHFGNGGKIIDPFMGSGTVRIAAYEMGYDFYGFEIDADYFAAQEQRFQLFKSQGKLF